MTGSVLRLINLAQNFRVKTILGLFLFLLVSINSFGQTDLGWKVLSKMEFEEEYNEEYGFDVPYPIFNEKVKALEGKLVVVEGYIIPLEVGDDHELLVLSKYPESTCFFCGMAGPETVIDILPTRKIKNRELNIQGKMKFKGILKLNKDNLDHMNYMLLKAEIVR